jgi:enoyl-CoA hydratase/carnithine racemase
MAEFETIDYDERDGVAWVTLDRPDVHNAFNQTMQDELHGVWRSLRVNDDVRCVVLTGAGDKAFCTGLDRGEAMDDEGHDEISAFDPSTYEDPGLKLGPKSSDLWKPVIAAVNGIACGGAFYLLGEAEFIIAADHATFFDPHVSYGMPAVFEPIGMLQRMPFGEIMRLSLLGLAERMSARRAHQIGLVSEVVPIGELREAARWAADAVAASPPQAVQGTVRAIWSGLDHSRSQAIANANLHLGLATSEAALRQGQARFASGERIDWRAR